MRACLKERTTQEKYWHGVNTHTHTHTQRHQKIVTLFECFVLAIPEAKYSWPLIQFSSVAQLCPTLCDPMNCSTPGLPVHHQLPEFTQTHVQRVGDAIQPSHPLSSPSSPAPKSLPASESFPMSQLFA